MDDIVARYNDTVALNNTLREEAEKLQSERTAFKEQIVSEQQNVIQELQSHLSKTEQDLARIRTARDELIQDQGMRRAREDQRLNSIKEIHDLVEIKGSRISSLEAEVERLRVELGQASIIIDHDTSMLSTEELIAKCSQLEKAYKALSAELPPLEQAFKKAHEATSKKVKETAEHEAYVTRLQAEVWHFSLLYYAAY